MKVLIVNTNERVGGAAVAANRLMEALNRNGEKAMMLVSRKTSDNLMVADVGRSWLQRWRFLWERWRILMSLKGHRAHLFKVDTAIIGADITRTKEFREADIIHLHWVNHGMLSLNGLRKIFESGKPVVWTMHDAWPSTAICHHTEGCKAYTTECKHCPILPNNGSENDLANKVWKRKMHVLKGQNVSFVACSRWLEQQARESRLLQDHYLTNIPNCIDTHVFKKEDKTKAREKLNLPTDKKLIMFAAQRLDDDWKGMKYLLEAINKLTEKHNDWKQTTGIILLGEQHDDLTEHISIPVFHMGYISDEQAIVNVYNAADTIVIPSLQDNLPNIIMEAMACGVPCVGFKTGGIPEMIDHKKNGYIAEQRNADDLSKGIEWVLDNHDYEKLSNEAIKKVSTTYSQHRVALKYIEIYHHATAFKRYRI